MKRSLAARTTDIVIIIIVFLAVLVCLLPVTHVVAVSFSSRDAVLTGRVSMLPVEPTIDTYRAVISDASMIRSLFLTIFITVAYTAIAMVISVSGAYALTKKRLKGRNVVLFLLIFTLYFNGGLIPTYLLIKGMGMINKLWALLIPGSLSVFNLLILKTFFATIPESLEESARIEGANEIQILARIILPLSGPVLATISLFYAVGRWNGLQDALFYITNPRLYPLQLKLYQIIQNSQSLDIQAAESSGGGNQLSESIKAASIVFATVPIVMVYPFLQRYFIKGVMLGSIKG
jgi:putative aldouronate transport system permease protein